MKEDKNDDITLTLIFQMFEVVNRCIDLNLDNPGVKLIIGKDFDPLVKMSRDLSKKYDEMINLDKRFSDPNELFNKDTDNLYNLILATKNITKQWQWSKAIKAISKLSK